MAIEVTDLGIGKEGIQIAAGTVMPLAEAPPWGDDTTLVGTFNAKRTTTPKKAWATLPIQGVSAHITVAQVTLHPLPDKKDTQYPSFEFADTVTVHRAPESFGESPFALLVVLERGLPIGILEARHARSAPYTAQELFDLALGHVKAFRLPEANQTAAIATKLDPTHQDALALAAALLDKDSPEQAKTLRKKMTRNPIPLAVPANLPDEVAWLMDHGLKAKRYGLVVTAIYKQQIERDTPSDVTAIWQYLTTGEPMGPSDQGGPPELTAQGEVHTWLPGRGLRGLWNKVSTRLDLSALEILSGVPIFVSGPHRGNRLNINSGPTFGHYNPAFITWFRETIIPILTSDAVYKAVDGGYGRSLKNLGRAFAAAYGHVASDRELWGRIAREYHRKFESAPPTGGNAGMHLQERFRAFSDRQNREGLDWYETNVAAGFWIRRYIDGTHASIHRGLMELLKVYDPQTYSKYHKDFGPEVDGACMSRCIDTCMATCVDEGFGDNCGGGCQDSCLSDKCALPTGVPTLTPHETHPHPGTCHKEKVQRNIFGEEIRREEWIANDTPPAKTKVRMCESADTEAIRKHPDVLPSLDEAKTSFVRCSVVAFEGEPNHNLLLEFGEDTFSTHTVMAVEVKPDAPPQLVFSTHENGDGRTVSVRTLCDTDGDGKTEVLTVSQTWKTLPEVTVHTFGPAQTQAP